MKNFEHSGYQEEIFGVYEKTRNNIAIEACPGSGKTYTILELLRRTQIFKSSIFLAFNKSIADELQSKIPPHSQASTIHSLGLRLLSKSNDNRFKVTELKNWIIGKQLLKLDFKTEKQNSVYLFSISKLVDLFRMNLCKTKEDLKEVADKYNLSVLNGEIEDAFIILEHLESYNKTKHRGTMMIDFVDMIYLPLKLIKAEDFPKFNVVFVDECQDISQYQYEFILRLLNKRSRTVFVGDSKQAIYSFMGADSDVFAMMKERENTSVLPLSYSYRCGSKIVEEANKVFPGMESPKNQHEGEVILDGHIIDAEAGDFILCRNNLPLIQSFLHLLKRKKASKIMGKEFGEELLKVLYKIGDFSKEREEKVLKELADKLIAAGVKNYKGNKSYIALVEKIVILHELNKHFEDLDELRSVISNMFSDNNKEDLIILSTIHKSKGLEANNVFALGFSELIPSPYAETPLEQYQEQCLKFVGVTRAINKLIYVKLSDIT